MLRTSLSLFFFQQGAIDMSKTLGVIKNIIPAIASTNALIAATAANEAFKIATSSAPLLHNYMLFNAEQGSFVTTQSFSKNPLCEGFRFIASSSSLFCSLLNFLVCGNPPKLLSVSAEDSLDSLLRHLLSVPQYALQNPRILSGNSVLFMKASMAQLRKLYEENLNKPLNQVLFLPSLWFELLNVFLKLIQHGDMITVSDDGLPNSSLNFTIHFKN